jgi:HEAT repeat protein
MLEGLDEVNWGLTYPDVDFVQLFRDLASPVDWKRQQAHFDLIHLERPSELDPVILRFLIELASSPNVPDRHLLLEETIAPYADYPDPDTKLFYPDAFTLPLIEAVHRAFQQGIPAYVKCLSDPDPKVRAAAALTLAGTRDSLVRSLWYQLEKEQDTSVGAVIQAAIEKLNTSGVHSDRPI